MLNIMEKTYSAQNDKYAGNFNMLHLMNSVLYALDDKAVLSL